MRHIDFIFRKSYFLNENEFIFLSDYLYKIDSYYRVSYRKNYFTFSIGLNPYTTFYNNSSNIIVYNEKINVSLNDLNDRQLQPVHAGLSFKYYLSEVIEPFGYISFSVSYMNSISSISENISIDEISKFESRNNVDHTVFDYIDYYFAVNEIELSDFSSRVLLTKISTPLFIPLNNFIIESGFVFGINNYSFKYRYDYKVTSFLIDEDTGTYLSYRNYNANLTDKISVSNNEMVFMAGIQIRYRLFTPNKQTSIPVCFGSYFGTHTQLILSVGLNI